MDAMDVDPDAPGGGAPPEPASESAAAHLYVVTAHKPSAVGHALVGAFTGPDDVNLIVSCVVMGGRTERERRARPRRCFRSSSLVSRLSSSPLALSLGAAPGWRCTA